MKKVLTLKNIVLFAGALFLLVAFFISFAAKLTAYQGGFTQSYNNIIWGCNSLTLDGVKHPLAELGMGIDKADPAALPLVGVILMILAAIGAILVALLVKKPWAKWVVVGLAVLAITGAIFQFFAMQGFLRGMVNAMARALGVTDKEAIEQEYQSALEGMKELGAKTTVSTLMGVFGIVGGLAVGASQFLPEKK